MVKMVDDGLKFNQWNKVRKTNFCFILYTNNTNIANIIIIIEQKNLLSYHFYFILFRKKKKKKSILLFSGVMEITKFTSHSSLAVAANFQNKNQGTAKPSFKPHLPSSFFLPFLSINLHTSSHYPYNSPKERKKKKLPNFL